MNTEQCNTTSLCNTCCSTKCFSWTPIVIGSLIAVGLAFLLNLFSTALGMSIYNVTPEGSALTVGGIVGFAIGIIASMFFAGWVAGYFGKTHCSKKECGAVYGFAAWCLALIISILIASPYSKFVTGYSSYLANTVTTTAVSSVSSDIPTPTSVKSEQEINELGKGAFVMFVLFFLGAAASTCGGYVGGRICCSSTCCPTKP